MADSLIYSLQSTQNAIEIDDNDDIDENDEPEVEFPSELANPRSSSVVHER